MVPPWNSLLDYEDFRSRSPMAPKRVAPLGSKKASDAGSGTSVGGVAVVPNWTTTLLNCESAVTPGT